LGGAVAPKTLTDQLAALEDEITKCRACPRLVEWREKVAREKRAAFANDEYWGRPVPGWGDPEARVLIVGLAPAAHGGNRTGRVFTGDRSGEWLFASLYRTGYANQPHAIHRDDGLELRDLFISAGVRCAPPSNKPTPEERDRCMPYLVREVELLQNLEVIVALGAFAWDVAIKVCGPIGGRVPRPKPRFGHLAESDLGRFKLIGSYHVSQQNTFTGKLTREMLDAVFVRARALSGSSG
jgi:uracil-DNA glycosylase